MASARDAEGDTFDYVVVGGGSAGSLLASRLSEDPNSTVCLLEAGPRDRSFFIHLPAGYIRTLYNPRYTAIPLTEPSPFTGNRQFEAFAGRTLGGTSSINGMVYNRGQAADYDRWAALGNPGWSYEDVLPVFRRTERSIGIGDDRYRGRDGDLAVTPMDYFHPLTEAYIAGAVEAGIPRTPDYNGATQAGVGYMQRAISRGWRMSGARSFLRRARSRRNLEIRTNALASAVLFEQRRAVGVRYLRGGERSASGVVRARREVVLCAGAVNSAKLLQISGVGAPEWLRSIGVPVLHAAAVGEHLQDHYSVRFVARARNVLTLNELSRGHRLAIQIVRWMLGLPSILAITPTVTHCFWKSDLTMTDPDIQCFFTPGSFKRDLNGLLDDFPGMTTGCYQLRPESVGFIRARSADPLEDPVIQPNYLATEIDRRVTLAAMHLLRQLLATPRLAPYFDGETTPGPEVRSDDELLAFARDRGIGAIHFIGSARMGPADDPLSVVDHRLCVHGLEAIRVADASIMPTMPSGNTCAPTYMVAEKAAAMIRGG